MDGILRESIAQASDDQLLEILFVFPGEFSSDSCDAAEKELRNRYPQEAQWDALRAAGEQRCRDQKAMAATPLSSLAKVFLVDRPMVRQ